MAKNVVGLFDNMSDARAALEDLRDAGFTGDDISFIANNARGEYSETTGYDRAADTDSEAEEGAGVGATGGAVLGGLAGLLVGLGMLAIPGVGPVIAAGTLATTLGSTALGAGIGAAAGGLVGALVGAGIPEEDANVYAEGVRRGGALLSVRADTDDRANQAADIMDRHNVVDIDNRSREYRASGWNRFDENAAPYTVAGTTASGRDADYDRAAATTRGTDYGTTTSGTTYGSVTDTGTGSAVSEAESDYDRSSKVGTAGGAVAGAATGTAMGAAGGPVGAVVGGVAGALVGGGVGAAGDAAGVEATDDDTTRTGDYDTTRTASGTDYGTTGVNAGEAYGSVRDLNDTTRTTDYDTTRTTDYDTTRTTGTTGYDTTRTGVSGANLEQGGEVTLPVVEEELRVGKREVETGGVRVNTRVEEVPVNEQVTLRDEEVHVDRRPVDRPVSDADLNNLQEGTFEVRERAEEAVVDKQARVVEEVRIRKDVDQRTENIQDTVRRTDVDVEEVPGQTRTTGYTETGTASTTGYRDTDVTGTTGTTGTTGYRDTDVTGTTGTSTDEGPIERGLGNLEAGAERATGADLNRSGGVGDRDTRDNY